MNDTFTNHMVEFVKNFTEEDMYMSEANQHAYIEYCLNNWPSNWGKHFHVLVFGDLNPPRQTCYFPELQIELLHEPQHNTYICTARTVLIAKAKINEISLSELNNAFERINILVGVYNLLAWCGTGIGWSSYITDTKPGGVVYDFDENGMNDVINFMTKLDAPVRQKVEAALYWLRAPRKNARGSGKDDVLKTYSLYWNAFECIVEAILLIFPIRKLSKSDKQKKLDELIKNKQGSININDIDNFYRDVIYLGFAGKAKHALQICFADQSDKYIYECFTMPDTKNRLYDIRNKINHGDIDINSVSELARIGARLSALELMVLRGLGRLLPYPAPGGGFNPKQL